MTEVAAVQLRRPRVALQFQFILLLGVGALTGYVVVAYTLVATKPILALAVALLPLLIWESTRLTAAPILLGLSLPMVANILGGEEDAGLKIALSDLLLVFIGSAILLQIVAKRSAPTLTALRPVALPVVQYCVVLLLLLLVHSGWSEVLQTGQRLELFLIPLIIGAFVALADRHVQVLKAYVLAATAFAGIWHFATFGLNPNPAGQFFGNAILLILAFRQFRSLYPCLLILVPGLFLTGSRGAVVATAVGLAVIAVIHGTRGRVVMTRLLPFAAVAVAGFTLLPVATQERLTTLSSSARSSSGNQKPGQFAIQIRQKYSEDANQIITAHRWTGIGVGNYRAGNASDLTLSADPHQVVLLQAAEGGYLFAGSFLFLMIGVVSALYSIRSIEIAPAAAAVLIATVAHGLVDIYWVRGTPVLGWLLVGMACGALARTADTNPQK